MATHSNILVWKGPWTEEPGGLHTVQGVVKSWPAIQETQVQSLGLEDPLEKRMATHSSILAWKIPWTEEPGGLHTVHWVAKSQTRLSDVHIATNSS